LSDAPFTNDGLHSTHMPGSNAGSEAEPESESSSNPRRTFALRDADGEETSLFTGRTPRQAALKAARRLYPAPSAEAVDGSAVVRLRERGTDRIHVYDGWAWREPAPANAPDWLGDEVVSANVSKRGVERVGD
jgi:hypothetical protein